MIAAQVLTLTPRAWADDSDIFGANIQPNVTIIIDSSGSMAVQMPADSYDPAAE